MFLFFVGRFRKSWLGGAAARGLGHALNVIFGAICGALTYFKMHIRIMCIIVKLIYLRQMQLCKIIM